MRGSSAGHGRQGLFIAIEGTDGSGISTQTARLTSLLQASGYPAWATKEPSGGPIGLLLRLSLTHRLGLGRETGWTPLDESTMALLFAADRLDHLAVDVLPRLSSGEHVLCDRYLLSTCAYQSMGVDLPWIMQINAQARFPDLTVFLDVPVAVSIERMRARGSVERYEQMETLSSVRAGFETAMAHWRARGQQVAIVDGTQTPDAVQDQIFGLIKPLLEV